jgi:methyl coenzyme M reductase subunit C
MRHDLSYRSWKTAVLGTMTLTEMGSKIDEEAAPRHENHMGDVPPVLTDIVPQENDHVNAHCPSVHHLGDLDATLVHRRKAVLQYEHIQAFTELPWTPL